MIPLRHRYADHTSPKPLVSSTGNTVINRVCVAITCGSDQFLEGQSHPDASQRKDVSTLTDTCCAKVTIVSIVFPDLGTELAHALPQRGQQRACQATSTPKLLLRSAFLAVLIVTQRVCCVFS